MASTPADGDSRGESVHQNRDVAAGGGAVAQLAGGVVAPGQNPAGGGQRQAVVAAAGDGRYKGAGREGDRNRGTEIGGGAVAQLAVGVVAPGEDLTGGRQRQAVATPGGDGGDRCPQGQAYRNR